MKKIVLVKGAGDIATGVIQALWRTGFNVIATEITKPSAIRRTVCLSDAVYLGTKQVEDVMAVYLDVSSFSKDRIDLLWEEKKVVVTDVDIKVIYKMLNPSFVVDATISKRNIAQTSITEAPCVIGLGPGFKADIEAKDKTANCHMVIETMRGHNLGRIILQGEALANTGIPGVIQGFSKERVLYSVAEGEFIPTVNIGDLVAQGQTIAYIVDTNSKQHELSATIDGLVRGLLPKGFHVHSKMKSGDIDPRKDQQENCFTISEKARAIGGAVLQAIGIFENHRCR